MDKTIEINRFTHDNLTYIVAYEWVDSPFGEIPFIFFYVTTKSGKKIRDKKTNDKRENHFSIVNKIKNPVSLYRKITIIFSNFLKDYEYVCFKPHEDNAQTRLNIYHKYLESIGFVYVFSNDDWYYFYARKNIKIKKKLIKHYK